MKIKKIIWLRDVVEKLIVKHGVEPYEVEEVFDDAPRFRFGKKGERTGEDVYFVLGQTEAGRYLAAIFIRKLSGGALILSARDMVVKERRQYERK